jgi:large subunit ribosomal protein L35
MTTSMRPSAPADRPGAESRAGAQASASIVGPMPKMKTHSGAKKRFRKTAKGKLRGRRAYSSHILEKKSPKRKRQMARPVEIAPADTKRVRTLLGGGK